MLLLVLHPPPAVSVGAGPPLTWPGVKGIVAAAVSVAHVIPFP